MSRLDRFEEILNSYEGREPDKHKIPDFSELGVSIDIRSIFRTVGGFGNKMGYLLGTRKADGKIIVEDAVFSESICDTTSPDYFPPMENAMNKAVGLAVYTGDNSINSIGGLSQEFSAEKHEVMPDLALVFDKDGKYSLRIKGIEYTGDSK